MLIKLIKIKNFCKEFLNLHFLKKTRFFNINIWDRWKFLCLYFIISSIGVCIKVFLDIARNQTSSKATRVNQKKIKFSLKKYITWKCFTFLPMINIFETLSEPIRVWLGLAYKITENDYHSRHFAEFIQTQKRLFCTDL